MNMWGFLRVGWPEKAIRLESMPPRQGDAPDSQLFRRCLEFAYRLEREAAEVVEEIDVGFGVLNPSMRSLWDSSYLVINSPGHSADELAGVAEDVFGKHGFAHRAIDPLDAADAERLEPGFRRLGWQVDRGVYMVHRRSPDRPREHEVEEVAPEETYELRREVMKEAFAADYEGDPDEVADQLLAHDRSVAEAGGDRWLIARHQGRPAVCCSLLVHERQAGVGQVENVFTAPAARNRGLARAVVLATVEVSRREGNELTFLGAKAGDWPWRLYQRLGFDPVGVQLSFVKR
jgi:GNAT superfamily N-acetyltransferase